MTKTFPSSQWTLTVKWAAATGLSWLFAHPLIEPASLEKTLDLEWVLFPLIAILTLVAATNFARALIRRRKNVDPGWWTIVTNTGWAAVVIVSLALRLPGSIAGVLQWLILRRYITDAAWWTLASSLGAFSAVALLDGDFHLLLAGSVVGLTQWLVLRREVSFAGWWVLASTIGWLVGVTLGTAAVAVIHDVGIIGEIVGFIGAVSVDAANTVVFPVVNAIAGLLSGVFTGASLVVLLRNRKCSGSGREASYSTSLPEPIAALEEMHQTDDQGSTIKTIDRRYFLRVSIFGLLGGAVYYFASKFFAKQQATVQHDKPSVFPDYSALQEYKASTASVPGDLYYSTDHLWVKVTGATGVIGLTDYAQAALGDVLYVKRPKVGHTFKSNETRCAVETASDVFYTRMPVSGKTVEVNRDLEDHPEWINRDSYGKGWIISIRLSNIKELSKLMTADSYNRYVGSEQNPLGRRQTTKTTSRSDL